MVSGTPASTGYGRVGPQTLAELNRTQGSGSTIEALREQLRALQARLTELQGNTDTVTNPSLATPTNLEADEYNRNVTLTWNEVTDATSYLIKKRETYDGSYQTLATTTDTIYTDEGISRGTRYYYTVTAIHDDGQSSASEYVYVYVSRPGGGGGRSISNNDESEDECEIDAPGYDIYVDSENGSDANTGAGPCDAFATLAAATAAATSTGDGVKIALARGSTWREEMDLGTLSDVTISSYGSGALPLIDSADIVSSWSKTGGQTNVYEASVSPDTDNSGDGTSGRLLVAENDTLLTRQTSIANVDSNPGSWYAPSLSSATTIYVHATDSENPASNGDMYEVSIRRQGLDFIDNDNANISGVVIQQGFAETGPFRLGLDLNAHQILTQNAGGRHHVYFESGTLTDFIAYGNDRTTGGQSNEIFVAFTQTDGEKTVLYDRVGIVLPTSQYGNAGGTYAHVAVTEDHDIITHRQNWAINTGGAFSGNAKEIVIEGSYALNTKLGRPNSTEVIGSARYNLTRFSSAPSPQAMFSPLGIGWNLQDSVFQADTSGGVGILLETSVPVSMSNTIFENKGQSIVDYTGSWATSTLSVNESVLDRRDFYYYYDLPADYEFAGDYNIYVLDSLGNFKSRIGSTEYTSLAAWQLATGEDANSITLTQTQYNNLFPNKTSGDWTMADIGVTFGDGTALTEAGPQNHWDWDTGSAISGAPTEWPDVPDTLEEAKEYVADPDSWTF